MFVSFPAQARARHILIFRRKIHYSPYTIPQEKVEIKRFFEDFLKELRQLSGLFPSDP